MLRSGLASTARRIDDVAGSVVEAIDAVLDTRTAVVARRIGQGWEVIAAIDGAAVGVLDTEAEVDWGAILDRALGICPTRGLGQTSPGLGQTCRGPGQAKTAPHSKTGSCSKPALPPADRGSQSDHSRGPVKGDVVGVEAWRASLRTVVAVPVRLQDGSLVGAVAAMDRDRVLLTSTQHGLLTTLADLLAHAYENLGRDDQLLGSKARAEERTPERHLVAEFAHDLRTPLAVIAGLAGLAQRHAGEAEQSRATAQAIVANAKRLSAMIDGLLDAEARANGELLEQPREIDLGGLVAEVAAETHHLLTHDEVDITFGGGGILVGQAHAVRRLLLNLTVNAAKYTSRGLISITANEVEGGAVLMVCDTGRGMSPSEVTRFERAYAKSEDSDGFGLGLSIVRRLGNVIGADVTVESERGVGTSFRVFIPTAITVT